MRQALKIGEQLNLSDDIDKNNSEYRYFIKDITGYGASCIVYEAYYEDSVGIKHLVRLKEFYPAYIKIGRDNNSNLIVKDEYKDKFKKEWDLFFETYKKNTMFQMNLETLNSTGNVQNLLYGNNTMYMVVNYNNGVSYDKVTNESLHDIFQVGLALTKTISNYHKFGYLHLDIKPENILKLYETNEMVILFDFGSIESIDSIKSGKVKDVSYSESWAAPEQLQHKIIKISEATDIYSIGAVLFYKIMGRIPSVEDRKTFATWEFDLSDKKFEGCNPKIFRYIKELFKKTLKATPSKRYKNTDELIQILQKLVMLSLQNSVYIKSNFTKNDNVFIGRKNEIKLIHDKLKNETDTVFLHGFGGIGKSVLAKQYAFLHRDEYDAIVFASYVTNLMDLIINDREMPVANFKRADKESDSDYFKRKMDKLCELSDDKILIIIDNFDVEEDDYLEEIINCGCKFIVTTRNDFNDYNYVQIEIEEFKNIDELQSLFFSYNKINYSKEDMNIICKIIEIVDRHTMTVELIAKQLRVSDMQPIVLYEKLNSLEGITSAKENKVKHRKDKKLNNKSIMMHLEIVFDMAKLSKFEKYILMNMSLIAHVIIDKSEFVKWCKIEDVDGLNSLIDKGWIEFRENRISLHQIIIDLVYNKLNPDAQKCKSLTNNMTTMAKMRIKNNIEKRNQYVKLISIFADRIDGKNIELAQFYNEFAKLLSYRHNEECFDYFDKSIQIYTYLDIKDERLGNVYFDKGSAFLKQVGDNNFDFFGEEEKIEFYFDNMKKFFDECIHLEKAINGENSLKVADRYIEIAGFMFDIFNHNTFILEGQEMMICLSYFENCLIESFKIKKEILGLENKETKDICYELYQYYTANLNNLILYDDLIQDKEKALYYGELYMGD